ncbi:putative integral membrane protein [Theileria parva strain Muguga]|uniref:putative integral membrane protein n=1 Tax=Theileria parva strain Muguga TaxID=333668 RepID=UPI001C61849A|nr:putative integral membrane protein [Theileria parva strain Muguga]KAF5153420.1 putative integral membrane protein [Theileria parva strain Muguga]
MGSGPRFELFKALGINYYGFHVKKNKIYDYLSFGVCSVLIGTTIYLGVTFVYNWRQSMILLRYHHAKLEVERAKYIEQIKIARENGLLPPRTDLNLKK